MEYFQSLYDLVYDYINPSDVFISVPTTSATATVNSEDVDNLINEIKKEIILEDRHFKIKYEDLQERLNNLQHEEEDDSKGQDDDNNNNFEKISVQKKKKLKIAFMTCIIP